MPRSAEPRRVGYVLKKFPRLSETFILSEILGLERHDVEVSVHSLRLPDDGRFHGELRRLRATVDYLPAFGQASVYAALRATKGPLPERLFHFLGRLPENKRGGLLVQALQLADTVRRQRLDHLHAHFMTIAAHTAYAVHLLTGVSFSVTAHAKDIFRHTVDREVFREVAAAAVGIVTVSDDNRRFIREQLLGSDPQGKVVRVYNGIALDEIEPRTNGAAPLVLAVGRLVEKKGFHVLLQALGRLARAGVPVRAEIVGEGDERLSLEAQRRDLGLEDLVSLPGALPREAVLERMRRARVLAAPCVTGADGNRDALPTVVLEGLAVGLPPVATRLGGIPEMVEDGRNGLLVAEGDVAALAGAIARLIRDDPLWERLSAAGRPTIAERFDRRATVPQLLTVFRAAEAVRS